MFDALIEFLIDLVMNHKKAILVVLVLALMLTIIVECT